MSISTPCKPFSISWGWNLCLWSYLQDTHKQTKPALIADACLVVDVLGADFRAHLVDRYVTLELKEYRRIFRNTDEAGQLDNISRRFAWFRRLLHTHEIEQGRVFPSEWRVGWHLLARFSEITRSFHASITCMFFLLMWYLETIWLPC